MHKLLIKTHNVTGMKYLCYTQKTNHHLYTGSGKYWKNHLKIHGKNYSTELIYQSNNYEEFKNYAVLKSKEFDIVNSKNWANLREEDGNGGDTVSDKKWITNGTIDKYILKTDKIDFGWAEGRSNCIFNNKEKQREFNKKSDRKKAGLSLKKTWDDGKFVRDHSKCGTKGEKNPTKRIEVKEKIKNWQLNRTPEFCITCNKMFKNLAVHVFKSEKHKSDRKNNITIS